MSSAKLYVRYDVGMQAGGYECRRGRWPTEEGGEKFPDPTRFDPSTPLTASVLVSLSLEYMTRSICMTAALITRGPPPPPPFHPQEPQQRRIYCRCCYRCWKGGKASLYTPSSTNVFPTFHRHNNKHSKHQTAASSLLGATGYSTYLHSPTALAAICEPMSMKGRSQTPSWTRSWANFHWSHFQFPRKKEEEYSTLAATADDDDQPLEAEDSVAGPGARRSRNVVRALIAALVILAVLNLALLSAALRLYKDSHKAQAQGHAPLLDTPVPGCKQNCHTHHPVHFPPCLGTEVG